MQVILKQDIKELGKKDSLVSVSDGYAKNYLIPRGLAVQATAGNMNEMKNKQRAVADKKQRELENAREIAKKISGKAFKIQVKSGENGRLFGAVANKDIAEAIKNACGLNIDKKKIALDEPIKQIGVYDIEAKIYSGVIAKFKVEIVG